MLPPFVFQFYRSCVLTVKVAESDCFVESNVNAFWRMLYEVEREARRIFHTALGLEELFCQGIVGTIGTFYRLNVPTVPVC